VRSAILNNADNSGAYQVESVRKSLEILCSFTPATPRWTLSGLSRALSIPKSTALNLLRTLQSFDFIRQDGADRSYLIGPRAHELGVLFASNSDLVNLAGPMMTQLREATQETVKLGILTNGEVLVVAAMESTLQLHTRGDVGRRWPLHSSAMGKALLASLSSVELEAWLATHELPRLTPTTIATPEQVMAAVNEIRTRGFSLDLEENEAGVRCIAANIVDPLKGLHASLSMSAPSVRLTPELMAERARQVVETAKQIQTALRGGARSGLRVVQPVRRPR